MYSRGASMPVRNGEFDLRSTTYGYVILAASVLCTCFIVFTGFLMSGAEFKIGDIVATVVIVISLALAVVIAILCRCNNKHKQKRKKIIVDRSATYIPVSRIMGSDCGVCLDSKDSRMNQVVKLRCNHTFHLECMTESLKSQTKCPVCRQRLKQFTPSQRIFAYFRNKITQVKFTFIAVNNIETQV